MKTHSTTSIVSAPLGSVATFLRGVTFKPEDIIDLQSDDAVVCLRTKNIQADLDDNDRIAIPSRIIRKDELYVRETDILVSTANSWELVGKCCWVPRLKYQATAGGFISILRANTSKVNARYLYHWFNSAATQHRVRLCGRQTTNISNMNYARCELLEIPLPPLAEQKRIADILDKADGIRRKRREVLRIFSSLRTAAFNKLFASQLAQSPEYVLDDVADVASGVAKGRKLGDKKLRLVPYLRVANVQDGYLNLAEIKTIEASESEIKDLALQHGDIVMTEGGDYDKLGRGALWDVDIPDCIHQNHVFRVRTNPSRLLPSFFVTYLQSPAARQYFLRCAKKTTNLASINMTQLRALPVIVPPLSLQKRFDTLTQAIVSAIAVQERAVSEAIQLFESHLQRSFCHPR